ncbi:hypothetical protein [Actimicrobium antarcticum]|uniref:Uncharacterized protein n=1 Tax=Actimicrobium antarcticum TaxID=1051899 RepID=A0ABP7TJE9_9BURK
MDDFNSTNLDYFEADQLKYAVQLWKVNKKAGGPDFDVLKFGREWHFAETVLGQALIADDDAVSACALQLMQLRLFFLQRHPMRAQKLGASLVEASASAPETSAPSNPQPSISNGKLPDSEPPKQRYLKGIR